MLKKVEVRVFVAHKGRGGTAGAAPPKDMDHIILMWGNVGHEVLSLVIQVITLTRTLVIVKKM